MTRPGTRNQNKRQRESDKGNSTTDILRKIHETGHITDQDLNTLYMICKPVCQGCRVNTKDNPNCFCGLVPPLNGSRKSGLWQKMSDLVNVLGPDPSKDLRACDSSPAGLTNLGATCYANSILQCLYMNKSFREGVFSVEPDVLRQNHVLEQLARLFAQLRASRLAFIDSAPFIKTLELDNGVQQDSHEFLTLLLSLLERCLSLSQVPKARSIVQDLFRGSVSHVTRCSKCGRESEASSKMEDFYELELNVKGLKTLGDSLDDYLSLEELNGDNQYFCESCNARVDATRFIKLCTLPDVLNFQLKRCVFIPKTTTKKKITSAFSFPGVLDMQQRLSEPSQVELVYDLSAVLIHKGTAVNSGHYIAHIKDENSDQWWEFDDEHVSNLGNHPFGEGSSASSTKMDIEKTDVATNGGHTHVTQIQPSKSSSDNQSKMFSSADAYMLMYKLRRAKNDKDKIHSANHVNGNKLEEDMVQNDGDLLSHIFKEIEEINVAYLDNCKQFTARKEKEMSLVTERRKEVRLTLSEIPARSFEEPYYWISADWIRQWADNVIPPVLDNTPIQCIHGKVGISKIGSMKRISSQAWAMLVSKYNGGPALGKNDYCLDCLIDGARTVVCADSYRNRRTLMRDIANDVLTGKCQEGTYYISKAWLQQWIKRKNADAPSEADAGPTSSIRCPHGELMPEQGAKRILVPEKLWHFFYEDALSVKPDDSDGCSVFHLDSMQCLQCCDELSEVACLAYSLREVRLKQRKNHEKLAAGKVMQLSPEDSYFLLPSQWLMAWRSYVNATGKNNSSGEPPETLDKVIDALTCEKHLRLLERPPDLVWRKGSISQKGPATDRLAVISEYDWNLFCEEWGGSLQKGISARIEFADATNLAVSSCQENSRFEVHLGAHDEISNGTDFARPVMRTCPEVCMDCIGERESCELMEKLSYCNEEIYVCFVRGKEAPKSIIEASDHSLEPDRRVSKRSRRTNNGNSVNLKVSASTSIYQLKMMIWESLGVVKENQILHKGTKVIDQESATLADMNIFPGDKLWVKDSEIHEHRDIADELCGQKKEVQAEEGFRGTLLTATISSQVV